MFVLLAWDVRAAAPLLPVGVLGVDDDRHVVEWLPRVYESADVWRQRIAATAAVHDVVDDWTARAGAIDLLEVGVRAVADLDTAVAAVVDDVLAAGPGAA